MSIELSEFRVESVKALKYLMYMHDLKQIDLVPIFKAKSIVSEVISCKRTMTVEHIQKLSKFFKVSPAIFFVFIQPK